MHDAACKTCPFWAKTRDATAETVAMGTCRHVTTMLAPDPAKVHEDWWCSEHPARQRDRLAAMAMQALFATDRRSGSWCYQSVAEAAYEMADAMLAQRAKETK